MSKKADKRARRRQQQGYGLPDVKRDYLAHLERRGRLLTTPEELRRCSVREPFYLPELGLTRECWNVESKSEPVPVIRTG
ncbi:hypothetical protein [Deinococcus apachensis]|uniref:hypothetical protein n=1 Tax=Deinococcus apachensis TaxID=309886 RepID=UPI0003775050|nr:hypothetical protein [Deinococcus apachensis]